LAIHWFPLCWKTNKQNLPPPQGKENLSLLGCMQPPLIGWAELTLLPKCVPHRIPQHFWPSLMRGVGSMGVYSHTSIYYHNQVIMGFQWMVHCWVRGPITQGAIVWKLLIVILKRQFTKFDFVWAAIPNSFSRWSIKQQTFSKSPRLELIPHFIHPKDIYRRNLEPMNCTTGVPA
jgi:hypothetical protein